MFFEYNKVQSTVLETTLNLLCEKDLQATSMALISKESGISIGSIYYYFKSKEEIINELYRGVFTFYREEIYKDFYLDRTIKERFASFWQNVICFNQNYPNIFQFLEQYSFSPYIEEGIKQKANQDTCGPLVKLYTQAIEAQLFSDINPTLMVLMHFGSVAHVLKAYLAKKAAVSEEICQTIVQSCWKAVSLQ